MEKFLKLILFSSILIILSFSSSTTAQTCPNYRFTRPNTVFTRCIDLPALNSFLHWTHHPSNNTVDIAYRHTGVGPAQWVAWALNIDGSGMIGAQCLVAHQNSSGLIQAYTSPVSGYGTQLAQGELAFGVTRLGAEIGNDEMIIFATLELPSGRTSFNQVWQEGPLSGGNPARHLTSGNNMRSSGTINFLVEQSTGGGGGGGGGSVGIPRQGRRNVHGVVNAISWGILMPLGAMIARYLKVFKAADPAWFYLHLACQISAYAIGIAGWATGLRLGSDSAGIRHATHGNIGVALFCLATLQAFALLLRPKKDHKYRVYWEIYHHLVGYTVIILSIVNVFRGFNILNPEKQWRQAYIVILIILGVNAVWLEAFTWYISIKRKKNEDSNKYPPHIINGGNGSNGVNGYGDGSQQQAV